MKKKKVAPPYFEITDASDIVRVTVNGIIPQSANVTTRTQRLESIITVKGCRLGGQFSAEFLPINFYTFRQQLVSLIYSLDKSATFEGDVGYLKLHFEAFFDEGYAEISVNAQDVPGIGSELTFKLNIELSEIEHLIKQLDVILERYPLIN